MDVLQCDSWKAHADTYTVNHTSCGTSIMPVTATEARDPDVAVISPTLEYTELV